MDDEVTSEVGDDNAKNNEVPQVDKKYADGENQETTTGKRHTLLHSSTFTSCKSLNKSPHFDQNTLSQWVTKVSVICSSNYLLLHRVKVHIHHIYQTQDGVTGSTVNNGQCNILLSSFTFTSCKSLNSSHLSNTRR